METTLSPCEAGRQAAALVMKPGQSAEKVTELYDNWSDYDKNITDWGFVGASWVAKGIVRYMSGNKNAYILDVAAGTGRVAEEIKKSGFTNIDALDASKGMLQKARKKNLYKQYFETYFNDNVECIATSTYDVLSVSGALVEGHLKLHCLPEMIRCTKPGGFVFLTTADSSLANVEEYKDKLEPYMESLQTQGLWERVERCRIPDYTSDSDGVLFVYKNTKTE